MFKTKHIQKPQKLGRTAARRVHLKLPVSFFIVIRVVAHGQCIREKIMVHTAVEMVQPFAVKISRSAYMPGVSAILPDAV